MKEYYSIPLEDDEAQTILEIDQLIDEPVKPVQFPGDIDIAMEEHRFDVTATFWYENHHVVGIFFLSTKLKRLPDSIGNLSFLRYLIIISSQIQYIPSTFKELQNLELLVFSNDIEIDSEVAIDFPNVFQSLNQLKTFHIDGNFIIYIPPSFIELKNLEELILKQCLFLTDHSYFVQIVEKIKSKSLEIKPNNELPKDLGKLKSLKKILLKNVGLLEIPISIINLRSLKELDLSHLKIKFINSALSNVFEINTLENLTLNYCELKYIPKTISNLTNLKILNLAHNNLKEIPAEIKECQKLEKIDLVWNGFGENFKNWIKNLIHLPKLNYLSIGKRYLKLVPEELKIKENLVIKGFP